MKKVILVGDSIRIGYQPVVQNDLLKIAQVWGPEENGRTSQKVLDNLDEWVISRQPDIVHINCGLHDLRREFGAGETQVPLKNYRQNVKNIFQKIQKLTNAQIIWATITPVNQVWHHTNRNADRFEEDVYSYNQAAFEICESRSIQVNDLFSLIMKAGRDTYLKDDGLHFKSEGYELLGHVVANWIKSNI